MGSCGRGPKAIYKTERRTCHVQDAWSWKRGHSTLFVSYLGQNGHLPYLLHMQRIDGGLGISQGKKEEVKGR